MKILKRTSNTTIKNQYEHIIAWGTGPLFRNNYQEKYFPIDCIIDGTGKQVGQELAGNCIKDINYLKDIEGKTLIIIYAIYESEILEQIRMFDVEVDTIIYSLIDVELNEGISLPRINAKNAEDILVYGLLNQIRGADNLQFLEVGVCHPIMRNNTYLLYEIFSKLPGYKGVLVEANPLCWNLIEEYRSKDKLIKKGIGLEKGVMPFYAFPGLLGHSTFVYELAEKKKKKGHDYQVIDVDIDTLNQIIEENFDRTPDLLAIDAEGLDFQILKSWDYKKYPFKIIISEMMEENEDEIKKIMAERGYKIYAMTVENVIWLRMDLFEKISKY